MTRRAKTERAFIQTQAERHEKIILANFSLKTLHLSHPAIWVTI